MQYYVPSGNPILTCNIKKYIERQPENRRTGGTRGGPGPNPKPILCHGDNIKERNRIIFYYNQKGIIIINNNIPAVGDANRVYR